jgi:hypothetical protein
VLGYNKEYKYIIKIQNNSDHTSKMQQRVHVLEVFRVLWYGKQRGRTFESKSCHVNEGQVPIHKFGFVQLYFVLK